VTSGLRSRGGDRRQRTDAFVTRGCRRADGGERRSGHQRPGRRRARPCGRPRGRPGRRRRGGRQRRTRDRASLSVPAAGDRSSYLLLRAGKPAGPSVSPAGAGLAGNNGCYERNERSVRESAVAMAGFGVGETLPWGGLWGKDSKSLMGGVKTSQALTSRGNENSRDWLPSRPQSLRNTQPVLLGESAGRAIEKPDTARRSPLRCECRARDRRPRRVIILHENMVFRSRKGA
jgi:hypothetical protein